MNIKFYKFLKAFIIFFSIFICFIIFYLSNNDYELFIDLLFIITFILGIPLIFIYLCIDRIIKLDYLKKTFSVELVKNDLIINFDNKSFSLPKSNINDIDDYYYDKYNIKLPNKTKNQLLEWLLNDYWYLLNKKSETDIMVEEQDFFKRFSVTEEVSDEEKRDILKIKKINNIIYNDLFIVFFLSLLFLLSISLYPIIYGIYTNIKIYILTLCFGAILFIFLIYYLLRYLKLSSFKKRFNTGKVYSMYCVPAVTKECLPIDSIHDILFKNNYKNQSKYYGLIVKNLNGVHLNKWFIGFDNKEDVKNTYKLYIIRSKDDYIDTLLIYKKEYELLEQQKKKS